LYGQENTISGDFSLGVRWISPQRYEDLSNYVLSKGDIVLTRKGSLGKARLIEELTVPGIIDSDTIRVRVNNSLLSRNYLSLLMHEAHYIAEQIAMTRRGSVLPGLNTEAIANLKVLLPASIDEQNELVAQVAEIIAYYRCSLEKCRLKCDLLAERRSALISAAVTGKIDVRNWQPPTEPQADKDTP
jgi:type I restriction enzyme S subunit